MAGDQNVIEAKTGRGEGGGTAVVGQVATYTPLPLLCNFAASAWASREAQTAKVAGRTITLLQLLGQIQGPNNSRRRGCQRLEFGGWCWGGHLGDNELSENIPRTCRWAFGTPQHLRLINQASHTGESRAVAPREPCCADRAHIRLHGSVCLRRLCTLETGHMPRNHTRVPRSCAPGGLAAVELKTPNPRRETERSPAQIKKNAASTTPRF